MNVVDVEFGFVEHRAPLPRRPWTSVRYVRVEVEALFFHKVVQLGSPFVEALFESVRQSVPPSTVRIQVPQVVVAPLYAEVNQRSQALAWMSRWHLSILLFLPAGLGRSYHDG